MSELPDAVRRAIEAANGGDTAAFVNLFTPDGVVDDWGREFAGRDAIRTWSDQEFIGVRVKLAVSDIDWVRMVKIAVRVFSTVNPSDPVEEAN